MAIISDSKTSSLAQHHYQKALDLEKQLWTLIQSKGPFDPNVRILRNNIRESYESVILDDHDFAESHDVEQSLWRLHYTRIEEFRSRIRKSMSSAGSASGTAVAQPGSKTSVRREPVNKILAVFRSFLSEATAFYHELILKIRAKHGLSQDYLSCEGVEGTNSTGDDKRDAELKRCQLSCHRCLIYLGDLARYKECHGEGDAANRDWSIAAGFYVKAALLWPSSGNPHNQLAVLATYVGDELLAVYHYFRSLAAETPFLTARDNLILLFEKNRQLYARLVASSGETISSVAGQIGPTTTGSNKGKLKGDKTLPLGPSDAKALRKDSDQQGSVESAVSANSTETFKSFRVRFVRLNGILFTRTSLETFSEVHSSILYELKQLLGSKSKAGESGWNSSLLSIGGNWGSGPNVVLQLVTILIFTVHNVNWGPDSHQHQPTYAEILQRSALLQHAFTATFECAGYLMQKCADASDASMSPLLPAMLVFMEWLACRPEMAMGTEVGEKEANARFFFWRKCANLLNSFFEDEVRDKGKEGFKGVFGGLSLNVHGEESEGGLVLWEDYELRGFMPLLPGQVALDYSKRPTVGRGSKKERILRVRRFIAAGKAISCALERSERGIYYDAETDRFYVAGDKYRKQNKREISRFSLEDAPAVETLEPYIDPTSFVDSSDKQLHQESGEQEIGPKDFCSARTASGEEEDEVIVFKPLVKEIKQITTGTFESVQPLRNAAGISNAMPSSNPHLTGDTSSNNVETLKTVDQKILPDLSPLSTEIEKQLPGSVSSNVSGVFNTPLTLCSQNAVTQSVLPPQLVNAVSGVPDASFLRALSSMKSTGSSVADGAYTDASSKEKSLSFGSAFNASGSVGSSLSGTGAGSAACLGSGAFTSWGGGKGFDMFHNQRPWPPAPGNMNWQPNDAMVSNSLWSSELQMLAAKGLSGLRVGSPNFGSGEKTSFTDDFTNLPVKFSSEHTLRNPSDIPIIAPHSVTTGLPVATSSNVNDSILRLLDGFAELKAGVQVAKSVGKDATLVQGQASQEISSSQESGNAVGVSSPMTKPGTSSVSDTEKAFPKVVGRPSSMRPPPGFGPLPARPPVIMPVVPALETFQSASDAQPASTPIASAQAVYAQDNSRSFADGQNVGEGDEQQQVDDYGWLDGYTPHRRETSKVANSGQVSSVGNSDYRIWSGGSNLVTDVTASPFPGMRLSDRYATPPPLPLQQQQHTLIAQLQQEVLKHQQLLQEQEHHQLLQEHQRQKLEQYQHLYSMQLLAQQEQQRQQHHLVQQQQQHQQQQQQQPQQQPQAPWYGQNYVRGPFVS